MERTPQSPHKTDSKHGICARKGLLAENTGYKQMCDGSENGKSQTCRSMTNNPIIKKAYNLAYICKTLLPIF